MEVPGGREDSGIESRVGDSPHPNSEEDGHMKLRRGSQPHMAGFRINGIS